MATIKNSEHVFIPGMTQSGKSFLARHYLANSEITTIIHATKGIFEWPEVPEKDKIIVEHLKDIPEAVSISKKIIYTPSHDELDMQFYNEFYKFCYYHRPCRVCIDELMQVCPSPNRYPEWLKGIYTRGAELGVSAWGLTQRPATIPVFTYDSATHWFVFKLINKHDRKRLVDHSGYDEFMEVLDRHVFMYYNTVLGTTPEPGKLVVRG